MLFRSLAAGDDQTDLDLYAALPPGSFSVHVGAPLANARSALGRAPYGVDSPDALRQFLHRLVERFEARHVGR